MQKTNYLRVFRPLNLLFLFVLQVLTFYFLDLDCAVSALWDARLGLLLLSTTTIAAAGYLINDFYDRDTDRINKPHNQPIVNWRLNSVWRTYVGLNVVGMISGVFLGLRWLIVFALIITVLWFYSYRLKRLPFVGNLVIAFFAFIGVYLVYDVFHSQTQALVVFYASLAALFTLLREITKDIEDIEGDAKTKLATFPVIAGFQASKSFLTSITVFTTVLYASFQYRWLLPSFDDKLWWVVVGYQLICIIFPMLYIIFSIIKAKHPNNMTRISKLFKYVMATGMLSMAFF